MGSFSLTSLLGGTSHDKYSQPPPQPQFVDPHTQVLTFRPSPWDPTATLLERANPNHTTTPLFSIASAKKSKHIEIHRLGAGNVPLQHPILVGSSRYSSLKSNTEITFPNTPYPTKLSSSASADGYKFTFPGGGGKMKWKTKMSGSLVLQDENKLNLARYVASSGFKGASSARLEILVPLDDYFLDVVVVMAMAAAKMLEKDKKAVEAMGEVVGAIAGA